MQQAVFIRQSVARFMQEQELDHNHHVATSAEELIAKDNLTSMIYHLHHQDPVRKKYLIGKEWLDIKGNTAVTAENMIIVTTK